MKSEYLDTIIIELERRINVKAASIKHGDDSPHDESYRRVVHFSSDTPTPYYISTPIKCIQDGSLLVFAAIDCLSSMLAHEIERGNDILSEDFNVYTDDGSVADSRTVSDILYREAVGRIQRNLSKIIGVPFSLIDELSLKPYEGEPASGNLIFLDSDDSLSSDNANDTFLWRINGQDDWASFAKSNLRQIRKIMAGAGDDALLFVRGDDGNAHFRGVVKEQMSRNFPLRISIRKAMAWDFFICNKCAFSSLMGDLIAYKEFNAEDVVCKVKDEFDNPQYDYSSLTKAIKNISTQKHGTSAIIIDCDNCSDCFQKRLDLLMNAQRLIKIETGSQFDNFKAVTRMDGAIILGLDGKPYYLAVLVDGNTVVKGSVERGARYNSIKNFTALAAKDYETKIVSVVFSEDGGFDKATHPCLKNSLAHI